MNAVQNETERMVLRLISRRPSDWTYGSALAEVKDFAAFVAAHERYRMTVDSIHTCHAACDRPGCVRVREAVRAEREACAKVIEAGINADKYPSLSECAAAIRARGET